MRPGTVAALVLVLVAGGMPVQSAALYERGTLHIYQGARRIATLDVEIARSAEARARGLMHRTALPENAGMLFIFEADGRWGFWMKNTLIPLSVGFIDRTWRLLEVLDMHVAPDPANGPFEIYEPRQAYRYALEVNQGLFARRGIAPGARLQLVPAR
ncbi:MAG: DUF192 domain-containing protein [Armatimonadota bacterium]|nr:DUF192 domain-containing protein [Armatimonadota bacterium]